MKASVQPDVQEAFTGLSRLMEIMSTNRRDFLFFVFVFQFYSRCIWWEDLVSIRPIDY